MGNKLVPIGGKVALSDLVEEFFSLKEAQGICKKTLTGYSDHIWSFLRWSKLEDCDPQAVRKAFLEYMTLWQNPYTFNLKLTYIKAYLDFVHERGYLPQPVAYGIKRRKTSPRIVSHDIAVIRKLLEACDTTNFTGLRDYTMILLTIDTGIRPGEARQLEKTDFRLSVGEVYIRPSVSKTREGRTLPVSHRTASAVESLMAAHDPAWRQKLIFCTYDGRPMNDETWSKRMSHYSQAIGEKVTAYGLRHWFALQYLRNGASAFHLQKMLGHGGMEMTRRYVELQSADQKEQHLASSPVVNLFPGGKRRRSL